MARNKRGAFGALTAFLLSGSLLSAIPAQAAETPSPSSPSSAATGTYEEQFAAYKIAFDLYKIAVDKYMQDRRSAEATFKGALAKYELDVIAFEEKHKVALAAINETFKNAIDKARTDQRSTQNSATSPEARNGLRTAMNAAVMAATTTRRNAIDAIGDLPVKPERPVFAPPPIEPRKPMQNPKGNQGKLSKPAKSQNAAGNSGDVESNFTA